MSLWGVKKSEYGGPVLVLNGEETDYGGILEVLVPGQEEYEDEYMKVSKIQQFFQFLQEISTLCVCSMHWKNSQVELYLFACVKWY